MSKELKVTKGGGNSQDLYRKAEDPKTINVVDINPKDLEDALEFYSEIEKSLTEKHLTERHELKPIGILGGDTPELTEFRAKVIDSARALAKHLNTPQFNYVLQESEHILGAYKYLTELGKSKPNKAITLCRKELECLNVIFVKEYHGIGIAESAVWVATAIFGNSSFISDQNIIESIYNQICVQIREAITERDIQEGVRVKEERIAHLESLDVLTTEESLELQSYKKCATEVVEVKETSGNTGETSGNTGEIALVQKLIKVLAEHGASLKGEQ